MDYFDSVGSSANIILTFIILVVLTIASIIIAIRSDRQDIKISIIVVCLLFLILPFRAISVSSDFNPINDLSVRLIEFETDYKHSNYVTYVKLQFTTETYDRLSGGEGDILFYDGDTLVATYPIQFRTVTNVNRNFYQYEFKESTPIIHNIDSSSLSIYCSIDTLRFSDDLNSKHVYDPIKLRLK
jgi:hypothetical protein